VQSHFEVLSRPVKPRRTKQSKDVSSAVEEYFFLGNVQKCISGVSADV
jgi:hypothetical protein